MIDHFTRRQFLRQTSFGIAGLALAAGGYSGLYGGIVKKTGTPAYLGGTPVRKGPFAEWPITDKNDLEMYIQAFKEKNWSQFMHSEEETMLQFEKDYAQLLDVKHCATTNAGTLALSAALTAVGVGPGDEVIVPTNTFVATAQSVYNLYAMAVYVDTDPRTFMIDPDKIEEKINENTKAILPVHIGGGSCDMDKIMALAEKYDLAVIEDACQAHMGEWRGKKLGTIGDLGCFSFQEYKSITAGEGGAIVGNDDELMNYCHAYKNNGRDPRDEREYPGTNLRMTAFQIAVVRGQLRHAQDFQSRREENATHLEKLLKDIAGITPAEKYDGQTRRAYYGYYLLYDKSKFDNMSRDTFVRAIRAEGVSIGEGCDTLNRDEVVRTYLELPHFQKLFSSERISKFWDANHCPNNDMLANETGLSLPQPVFLGTKKDIEELVAAMAKIQTHAKEINAA